jgi:uncharacterized protein (DUF305 family)
MTSAERLLPMSLSRLLTLTFAASLLGAPAFAQSSMNTMPGGAASHPLAPADQAMMAGMATMDRDMAAVPMTGNADQDFVAMMIPHHEGAVAMAEVELRYGHDPYLRRLAETIIQSQAKQIAGMKDWQKAHPAH